MRDKNRRQNVLMRLVRSRVLANQGEMVRLLKKAGVEATQASVSRDVRELGLVKVNGRYASAEGLVGGNGEAAGRARHELITQVQVAGANLIVVRTPPGHANTVAIGLDEMKLGDIIGTVAGDDTIFIAVRSRSGQGRVVVTLKGMMR